MKRIITMVIFFFLLSSSGRAIIEPISRQEAIRRANLVVDATVVRVIPKGKRKETDCTIRQRYLALLKVQRVIKGKPAVQLRFHFTHVILKPHCDGQPQPLYRKGETRRFYLRCKDGHTCWKVYRGRILRKKR